MKRVELESQLPTINRSRKALLLAALRNYRESQESFLVDYWLEKIDIPQRKQRIGGVWTIVQEKRSHWVVWRVRATITTDENFGAADSISAGTSRSRGGKPRKSGAVLGEGFFRIETAIGPRTLNVDRIDKLEGIDSFG